MKLMKKIEKEEMRFTSSELVNYLFQKKTSEHAQLWYTINYITICLQNRIIIYIAQSTKLKDETCHC